MRSEQWVPVGMLVFLLEGRMSNKRQIMEALEENPNIMAVKNNRDLKYAMESDLSVVFVLYGNINNITAIVEKLKSCGKFVIVHEDLIEGLSQGPYCNDFISRYTQADGIITTKLQNALHAKQMGLFSVLRFFLLDSMSFETMKNHLKVANCDLIEILPGVMPKIIEEVRTRTSIPVVAGGLIKDKEDVIAALKAGAFAISSSNYEVWNM